MSHSKITLIINLLVGSFFLTALIIKTGYAFSPFVLILTGLGYFLYSLVRKRRWQLDKEQKRLMYSYGFYVLLFIVSFFVQDGTLSELERPARVLLLLPLVPLFMAYPLNFGLLRYFIPAGSIIAAVTALFDRFYLHSPMAFTPRIMHIQGGDIAMSLGMFSLVLGMASLRKNSKTRKYDTALYFTAALCGVLGSLLSTARGGWIGMPFIVVLILWLYRDSISKRFFTVGTGIIAIVLITAIAIPQTQMLKRINQAGNEITDYIQKDNGSTSVGARFDMWKSSWLMIREKPIFGWGASHILEQRREQYRQGLISEYASQFSHSHNQMIDDTSKRGILGLVALLTVLLIPLRYFWQHLKTDNDELKAVAVLGVVHVVSVLFYGLSQAFFAHNSGIFFYFFLVIVFYGLIYQLKKAEQPATPSGSSQSQ